jgi:hypothetical protein
MLNFTFKAKETHIYISSLVALLYQPYLHLSYMDHTSRVEYAINPLQRMKEGSQGVEFSIISLKSRKEYDALPNWL